MRHISTDLAVCSPGRWQTKFAQFVRLHGTARLARELEVDPAAVYQWVRGKTTPRLPRARLIIRLAEGVVDLTLEDIYQHCEQMRTADARADAEAGQLVHKVAAC